jgi:hypothetical protein
MARCGPSGLPSRSLRAVGAEIAVDAADGDDGLPDGPMLMMRGNRNAGGSWHLRVSWNNPVITGLFFLENAALPNTGR